MDDRKFNERRASEGAAAAYAFVAVLLMLMLAIGAGVIALARPAAAHSWYDGYCCSDKDCAPVRASTVRATAEGWEITLAPGDHPMVSEPVTHFYRYDDTRVLPSQDDDFHVCLNSWGRVLCLYVPLFGA